jgi:peptide/nickel transport system substrate-binding protein
MPSSIYFSRANKLEFSMMLVGWGADTGEASSPLKALLATYDPARGMGTTNRGRYSNAKLDTVISQALATVEDAGREKLLQEATEIAIGDLGIIPLYHQVNVWAVRKGLAYKARTDERTYAFDLELVRK